MPTQLDKQTWICVGGGPSAPRWMPRAICDYPLATTITTNSGILLCVPDYYFIYDHVALPKFCRVAQVYQNYLKTSIVTLKYKREEVEATGLRVDHTVDQEQKLDRQGPLIDLNFSGLYSVIFALRHRAKVIVAVGNEGYAHAKNQPHHWDCEQPSGTHLGEYTQTYIAPWWQDTIRSCPKVKFRFYGQLNYSVSGPNVEVIA